MTPEKVIEVQKYGREPISLHTPLGEDGDSEFGDLIEDTEAVVPADAVGFTMLQKQLESLLDSLSEREAGVIRMRFGPVSYTHLDVYKRQFPFLSIALGYGPTGAAGLLTIMIASAALSGPILGLLSARFPLRRSNIVLGIVTMLAALWGATLAWPATPPLWLIVLLLVFIAASGPGSLIGFDFARTFNPQRAHGLSLIHI